MGQCPRCGAKIAPEQTTCNQCGSALDDVSEPASPEGTAPSGAGADRPSPGADRRPAASASERSGLRGEGAPPAREAPRPRPVVRTTPPSGTGPVVPLLVALILSIVMQQLLNTTVPTESYVYRLFRPSGGWGMAVVPALIAFIFFWTITDLVLKFRVTLKNERDVERPEVKQLPAMVAQEPTHVTVQRLRSWDRGVLSRPVGRRMLWLLRHLDTVDARRAHELVRHQSDLDADSAASGYRAVKLFVWAMPILGFIGTVLGISLAVGGFSEFLTTNVSIEEIDAVTAELGNVASGLSFAFDTTLLGLLAGLVANVTSSAVQGREERFITGLEELGLRVMAEAPSTRPDAVDTVSSDGEGRADIDELVRAHLEQISGEMDRFNYAVRRGLQSLSEASARISRGMETSIESVNETMEGLGDKVKDTNETLDRNMRAVEEANRRLSATLAQLAPVLDRLAGPMEVRLMPQEITPPRMTGGEGGGAEASTSGSGGGGGRRHGERERAD